MFLYVLTLPSRLALKIKPYSFSKSLLPLLSYASLAKRRGDITSGGRVKLIYLSEEFPEQNNECNILYLVSSALPRHLDIWIQKAKKARIPIVLNQNGVAYKGWFGKGWEIINEPLQSALHSADYIFYQSRFSQLASEKFLGKPAAKSEILYNAVDTKLFSPVKSPKKNNDPVVLLGGNQYQWYRFESALQSIARVKEKHPGIKLLVSGVLSWQRNKQKARLEADVLIKKLHLENSITLLGSYTQEQAPEVYRQADVFLHTKYNDPCPTAVIEALSCGLPVVYSDSGGVKELVGDNAGIPITSQLSWEQDIIGSPESFANALEEAFTKRDVLSQAARQRALTLFDITTWLDKQKTVFKMLLTERTQR